MSERDWRHYPLTGVAIFALTGLGASHYVNYHRDNEAGYAQQESGEHYSLSSREVMPGNVPSATDALQSEGERSESQQDVAEEPHWSNYADLFAQWSMAVGTFFIVGFTWLGLRVLRRTLKETELAAQHTENTLSEARKTTRAAFDSNEIALDVARTQFGGMVVAQEARVKYDPEEDGVYFQVKVENIGDTPVYAIRHGANCEIHEGSHALVGVNEYVWPSFNNVKALGPGDHDWATVIFLDKDQAAKAQALVKGQYLKVWGAVSWTGISRLRNAYLFAFHTKASIEIGDFKEMYRNPWGNTLARKEDLHRY